MTGFSSSDGSAYEVKVGATAEDAAKEGLAVVEYNYSTNPPTPIYGRYKDAPKGSPLGETVDDRGDTKVVGVGGAPVSAPAVGAQKGALVNANDPVIHGTADADFHADNSDPQTVDAAADEAALKAGAHDPQVEKSVKDAKTNTK